MRVFVAGATGALGRHLVPMLAANGHQVVGSTRSPAKADLIKRMGAEPAIADGLDANGMRAAVISATPDVVIHQMTDLAAATDLRHFDRAFARTNELRTRGTDILLAAAREAGARRFIAQSFCGWTFSRSGGAVKAETDELDPHPPEELRRTLEAIQYLERTVTASTAPEGIVLRYGFFYGAETGTLSPAMRDQLFRRRVPLVGDGGGYWSFINTEDAASATLAAIGHGVPGNIYNIVDDHPARVREWLPALAGLLGARPPFHVPAWLGRLLAGEHMVAMMTQVRGASNAKAKDELGWHPAHPSWRQGFAELATTSGAERSAA
ncbi:MULTISPECIES: NAD-dependent epimerase/dehydratase family protein [unclassified Bradyrhizobium]|uniref:NAD-dependent epimerase/dehydratase family protein n=1 Tax=unclassified Bradyrhizobium TaxID=2631580 RepID=UPI00247A2600|nr:MULTISPECIES: NAD-dependent epimerase/dehydratase family protein [unclassified Bradyrhizobium]WGR69929.1 NAD-dependent epimerase/dehydratase family protein [Bradyrhizobium sp. ISRA426]WGR81986.1 NAD-dependent epimerase/dehydratase family protein [Bradyrhizobium sp. ISRA430]WGR85172.1 NAD-dependent epimerase/dehydratase family protein [Bradyrhizobium sp. ISRA432]